LIPVDKDQSALLEKLPLGSWVTIKVTQDRNPKFHRKYFAMLNATFDMQDEYSTLEDFRKVVTVGAGHCDFIPIKRKDGTDVIAVPKSISFENMDELEFQQVYEDSVRYIADCVLPYDCSPDELLDTLAWI
jgi:hypothetical protein